MCSNHVLFELEDMKEGRYWDMLYSGYYIWQYSIDSLVTIVWMSRKPDDSYSVKSILASLEN